MVECSLCSIISFLFVSVYNIVLYALEYPIVILCLLLFVSLFCITNLNSGKFLCELSRSTIPLTGGGHHDEHHDRFGIGKPMANGRCCDYTNGSGMINKNFFNYDMDNGPHTWKHSGNNQSPINIIEERVQRFPIRELLTWNHYEDLPTSIQLENNGKTVIVRASYSGNVPTVCGADLLVSYTFVQLCFRWSSVGNDGSEHMLNHRKFPLELQAMHRTGPQTGDCTSSYDLLMIAYFFQISSNNPYLEPIVQNLHRIQQPYTKVEIDPFPLSYLCQQFRSGFYSYGGSLTEPPCYQGAEWFITPEPLAISEAQLNEFRKLFSGDGKTRILRNSRPVQQMDSQRGVNLNWYNPVENINHMPPTDSAVQCGDDAESYEQ